jgi:hypothetical protein
MTDRPSSPGHEKHCFVVMPFGRDAQEQKWFKGWFEVVVRPAVSEAGYEPKLSAAEEEPGAINDEIRTHLALDPMILVDLAGAEAEDEPNPNVMYELGIRHALGLPLVMMAWKGQRLPFDVSNQRVIMEDRDLVDLETNRRRIVAFIKAAEEGRYYKPMDAVSRIATIAAATASLGEDSLLRALTQEIHELRSAVSNVSGAGPHRRPSPGPYTMKKLTKAASFRKELYPHFIASGGPAVAWSKIVRTTFPSESVDEMKTWGQQQWMDYVGARAREVAADQDEPADTPQPATPIDEANLSRVRAALPPQPWPVGTHREIATSLDLAPSVVSDLIKELIRRGEYLKQINGKLVPSDAAGGSG